MSYTEFVSAAAYLGGPGQRTLQMLSYRPEERPITFQIFDSDEDRIVEVARRIEALGPDVVDLNMGCSVRKVSGRGAGAGLLRDPRKIGRIFSRLSRKLKVPVAAKIRLGWDDDSRNYLDVVRALQDNGASLVAVHGRTKAQAYSGEADWDAIARVVEIATVPVIGNGDVRCVRDIDRIKRHTGCTAVMIARGAMGHPWIFGRRDRSQVDFTEKADFIRRHFKRMSDFYGQSRSLILIRKHITRYLKQYSNLGSLQKRLVQVSDPDELDLLLDLVNRRLIEDGESARSQETSRHSRAA